MSNHAAAPGDRYVPWLDVFPKGCLLKPVKYVCAINARSLPETTDPGTEFRYVDISNVDSDGNWVASEPIRFGDSPSRARRVVADGDVIVSTVRTYLRAIAHIDRVEELTICSTGFAVLSANGEVLSKFLAYWARSVYFVDEVVARSVGVSYPAVNAPDLGNIPCPVLSPKGQRAIAAFLDRETARIDALIEKKSRQIALLHEKRAAVISHAVTKGLDPTAQMKDSGIDWLDKVPAHWHHRKLGYLVTAEGGCTPSKSKPEYWIGDIPWVSPKDMKTRVVSESEDHVSEDAVRESSLRLLDSPVVLMVVRGMILAHTFPVALTAVPVTINQDMKALRPKTNCSAQYLAHLLDGISSLVLSLVEESAHGTKCLRTEIWKGINVYLPSPSEQAHICAELERHDERISRLADRIGRSIDRLREYRTALISAAVTGKLDMPREVA